MNCRELEQKFVDVYGDESVVSADLISVRYEKLSGTAKTCKTFEGVDGPKSLYKKRYGVYCDRPSTVSMIKRVLMTATSDELVKTWLAVDLADECVVFGWISPQCVLTVFGGSRGASSSKRAARR